MIERGGAGGVVKIEDLKLACLKQKALSFVEGISKFQILLFVWLDPSTSFPCQHWNDSVPVNYTWNLLFCIRPLNKIYFLFLWKMRSRYFWKVDFKLAKYNPRILLFRVFLLPPLCLSASCVNLCLLAVLGSVKVARPAFHICVGLLTSVPKFLFMYFDIKGLKTGMYYLRSRAAVDAIKFTVDTSMIKVDTI